MIAVILLVTTLMARFVPERFSKTKAKATSISKGIIWNAYIRFYFEEYIAISLAGLLKVYSLDFSNWYETVSSIFAIICLASVLAAPVIIWRVLY